MTRESMSYDVVIVGGGPAGLAAAIRLKQLAAKEQQDISICILEKGSEIGAHILSGAVIDPIGLNELIPDWKNRGAPVKTPVQEDRFLILTETDSWRIPQWLLPPLMRNHGNYIVSLSDLCRWLAQQAETLGIEIYPGFPAAEILLNEQGAVCGVVTGDLGIHKDGSRGPEYQPGMELHARYTLFAEGCRGHLSQQLMQRFNLRDGVEPQKYGIGFKELWEAPPGKHQPGLVIHSQGWPLDNQTGGGAFLYHLEDQRIAVGFVVHLNYSNPHLSPYDEFQRFKTHPTIRPFLQGGKRIGYGARAINEGGLQSIPRLIFPGGALIGCAAGFVNLPRIKGSHNAMKSGMLAAEACFSALTAGRSHDALTTYPETFQKSWAYQDLDQVRNTKPALSRWGLWGGTLYSGFDLWSHSLGIRLPWTFRHGKPDHECLQPAESCSPPQYPSYDGTVTFDKLSSVFLSNTNHNENQPAHLKLRDPGLPNRVNWPIYRGPEQRYCPAGVYEYPPSTDNSPPQLHINAPNCIHCKTCDIKDPRQNIQWVTPEGGGGPNYSGM